MRQFKFCVFFLLFSMLAGCRDKAGTSAEPAGQAQTQRQAALPFPTEKELESLGPVNDLPGLGSDMKWFPGDIVYVVLGHPKRFMESEIGKGNEALLSGMIGQLLQIPFDPSKIERFVQVNSLPAEVTVEVEQNGQKVPQQTGMSRRSTMLTFSEPVTPETIVKPTLHNPEDTVESRKKKSGNVEYYDLTPPNFALPQRLAMTFPDDKTLVIVEGFQEDIDAAFDENPPKSAALERLKRQDVQANDLIWITSQEGIEFDPMIMESVLTAIVMQGGIPQATAAELAKHLKALTLTANLGVEVGKPMLNIRFDAKDGKGADTMAETFEGIILMGQTTLDVMDDAAKTALPIPPDFAKAALEAFFVNKTGTQVDVVLNKFESFASTAAAGIRNQQTTAQTMQIQRQRAEQFTMLGRFCVVYFQENGKFPADILAADGTPLLSWRVALLPTLGLADLHAKFKLDEPWDSETNKPLMEMMPLLFRPFAAGVMPPKTQIQYFCSEGTPLANRELKREDIKFPESTLMLYESAADKAVEWTQPGSPAFDAAKMEEAVGKTLFGVTFNGQIIPDMPIIPLADERSTQQRKFLEALVKGLPMPETPRQMPPLQTPPVEVPPSEVGQ